MALSLIKEGIQIFQMNDIIDKVNKTVEVLKTYDTNGNLELEESEIRRAIQSIKTAIKTTPDKKVAAKLAELRCLLVFVGTSQKMWLKDPKRYDELFSRAKPTYGKILQMELLEMSLFAGRDLTNNVRWDPNPKIAKWEKIICTFYNSKGAAKLRNKIEKALKEEANDAIQEELFGTTFQEIAHDVLSDNFGDIAAEIFSSFI